MSIGKLNVGDRFGALRGEDNWLYCEVERFDGAVIYAHVINGAWTARFNTDGTVDALDYDHVVNAGVKGYHIAYTGPFPPGLGDYNAVIAYMSQHMKRGVVARWASGYTVRLSLWFGRLSRSVRMAKNAFARSWNPHRPMSREEADDLEIPF